jgi:hypothetical protein
MNGVVLSVPFVKNISDTLYTAYTVLKYSVKNESDNLYYEYMVGKMFINKYINVFPGFLETYDFYYKLKKDNNLKNNLSLIDAIKLRQTDFSCKFPTMCSILIQYLDNVTGLRTHLKNKKKS